MKRRNIFEYITPATIAMSFVCVVYLSLSYFQMAEETHFSWMLDMGSYKASIDQVKEWSVIQWIGELILNFVQRLFL